MCALCLDQIVGQRTPSSAAAGTPLMAASVDLCSGQPLRRTVAPGVDPATRARIQIRGPTRGNQLSNGLSNDVGNGIGQAGRTGLALDGTTNGLKR